MSNERKSDDYKVEATAPSIDAVFEELNSNSYVCHITACLTKHILGGVKVNIQRIEKDLTEDIKDVITTIDSIINMDYRETVVLARGKTYPLEDYEVSAAFKGLVLPRKVVALSDYRAKNLRYEMHYDAHGKVLEPHQFKAAQQRIYQCFKKDVDGAESIEKYCDVILIGSCKFVTDSSFVSSADTLTSVPILLKGDYFDTTYYNIPADDWLYEYCQAVKMALRG